MVWYGMVWYGMVWYGMVWYGMVWYGMVWHYMIQFEGRDRRRYAVDRWLGAVPHAREGRGNRTNMTIEPISIS